MKTMTVASPIKNIRRLSLVRQDGGEIWLRHPLLVLVAISVARPATCRDVFSSRFTGAPNVGGQPRAAPTRLVFFARGRARLVGCSALFGSPPLPRTALVVLRTPRSASLTASAEGKAAATSGSSRTRLLPLRSRATYLPRTPPFIDAKSYSGLRSSSSGRFALLIEFSFAPRCSPGADDADGIVSLSVGHNQDASTVRRADRQEARLLLGVSLVRIG